MGGKYLRYWSRFLDLCGKLEERSDQEDIMERLVNVEVTLLYSIGKKSWTDVSSEKYTQQDKQNPQMSDEGQDLIDIKRYAVHFMFPILVSVNEELPNIDTVTFHIAHWCCTIENPKIPEEMISEMVKTFKKLLVNFAIEGKPDPMKPMLEMLHGMKSVVQQTELSMNGQGDIIKSRAKYLPTKRTRKKYCHGFFEKMMEMEILQNFWLRQASCVSLEKKFLENYALQELLPPFHIGWTQYNGNYRHIGYFNSEIYGNTIQTWPQGRKSKDIARDFDWELPFTAIPLEISIPLFTYDLFSVIKPFISEYPSRISLTEPYVDVRAKKRKIFFMSLSGDAKEKIAETYCGMFSKYWYFPELVKDSEDVLSPKLLEIYRTRVHDGVVILRGSYTTYQKLEDYDLLRDACCLCLNAKFDRVPNEIALRVDNAPDKEILDKISFTITGMIKGFVADLQRRYAATLDNYSIQWAEKMIRAFDRYYEKACKELRIQPGFSGRKYFREHFPNHNSITWDTVKLLNKILNFRFRELKTELDYVPVARRRDIDWNKLGQTHILRSERVDSWYLCFQKENIAHKGKVEKYASDEITQLNKAKGVMKNMPRQIVYLYAAIESFCVYLDDTEKKTQRSNKLRQLAYQVLADLNEQPLNIIDVISSYISKALEEGTIICFRTTQEGKVSGWYDSKKNLIYLPYRDYYSNFNEYWNESHKHAFPFTKERFQKELLEEKVLVVHESQKKGNYRRCQCQVIVDPPVEGQPSVQRPVLKVNIGKLTLSPEAEQQLKKLDKIIVPRRRKSIKSTG